MPSTHYAYLRQVLYLFAYFFDLVFHFQRRRRDFHVVGFGTDGIAFAVEFLYEEVQLAPHRFAFADVIKLISEKKLGMAMIVNENGSLTGVLTDGDIRRTLIKYQNIRPLLAKDVMSVNPKHISAKDYGASALNLMEKYSITALAVVDENNKPIGVIHIHDLLKAGVA